MDVRRVISAKVVNEHGVLSRISGLFAGRGYNIESLTVAPIPDTDLSRVTIATCGDERVIEQIIKQLYKLVPILSVVEHDEMVEKEMAMVKFPLEDSISDIEALANAYNGHIANTGESCFIVMIADRPERVNSFLNAVQKRFKPKEIVKSGVVAIERN